MHSIKEIFDDIVLLADVLEENAIDALGFPEGIEIEKIKEWEQGNAVKLPQGYKDFIVLANGFNYRGTQILPLERIEQVEVPEKFKGCYMLGSFIGDGFLILSDEQGNFYCGDHVFGVEKEDLYKFLNDNVLDYMIDDLKENDIEIPELVTSGQDDSGISEAADKLFMKFFKKHQDEKN